MQLFETAKETLKGTEATRIGQIVNVLLFPNLEEDPSSRAVRTVYRVSELKKLVASGILSPAKPIIDWGLGGNEIIAGYSEPDYEVDYEVLDAMYIASILSQHSINQKYMMWGDLEDEGYWLFTLYNITPERTEWALRLIVAKRMEMEENDTTWLNSAVSHCSGHWEVPTEWLHTLHDGTVSDAYWLTRDRSLFCKVGRIVQLLVNGDDGELPPEDLSGLDEEVVDAMYIAASLSPSQRAEDEHWLRYLTSITPERREWALRLIVAHRLKIEPRTSSWIHVVYETCLTNGWEYLKEWGGEYNARQSAVQP